MTTAAAAIAGTPLVSAALGAAVHTRGQDRKIGFAICGLGSYAKNQILANMENTQHCKPAAFVTGDVETDGYEQAEKFDVPRENVVGYGDIDQLAGRDGVDVLYVITPTGLHMKNTLQGFDAGLHVLCEKPMASTPDECDQMIAASEAAGKKLMIGYRCFFEPHNLRAMELAGGDEYGKVEHFHGDITYQMRGEPTWRNNPKLSGGGGPLPDLGIYMVNGARYITGAEPTHVSAQTFRPEGNPLFPEGLESRVSWMMKFHGGVTATSTTAYDLAGSNKYRVSCENGWFELDPATGYGGHRLFKDRNSRRGPEDDIPAGNQFAGMLDHMALAILNDEPIKTNGAMGRQDIHLIHKIYESAEKGEELEV